MARTKRLPQILPEPKALNPLPPNTKAIIRSGTEAVAYHIPTAPPSSSTPILKSTIVLPRHSKWTSGLHFHTTHTEYLRLVQGSIFVKLDGELKLLSVKAGGEVSYVRESRLVNPGLVIKVDKYARHNWGRLEEYMKSSRVVTCVRIALPEDRDDDVIVEEWTDPADTSKALFFWNLNGVITASPETKLSRRQSLLKSILGGWWIPFQLFVIFWHLDNWPIFFSLKGTTAPFVAKKLGFSLESITEYLTTFVVLFFAKTIGSIMDVKAVSKERTPDDLWDDYKKNHSG